MVKVKVRNITFGEREVDLKEGTVSELTKLMGTNDDAVIFVADGGEICTEDSRLGDGSLVDMIEVFSGG